MDNLKRFTTQYKGADDRFLLTGEFANGNTVSLWFTQRLLLKVMPVLIDWLQKNNPADLKTTDNAGQAQEMAKVFTRKPVKVKAAGQTAQSASAQEPEPVTTSAQPRLVQSIDFTINPKLLRLRFRDGDDELASLSLNPQQLRQWLAVLQVLWKSAGWPAHIWPRWLADDTRLVSNETQGTFH